MRAMANQRVYFEVRSFSDFSSRLFNSVFSISNLFSKIRSISNTHSNQIFPFGSLDSLKESVILTDRHSFIRKENQKINNKSEIYEECDSYYKIQLCGCYYSACLSFSNFSKKSLREIGLASAFRFFQMSSFSFGVDAFAKGFSGLFLWVVPLFEIIVIKKYKKYYPKINRGKNSILSLPHRPLLLRGFLSCYSQISLRSTEFFWSCCMHRQSGIIQISSNRQSLGLGILVYRSNLSLRNPVWIITSAVKQLRKVKVYLHTNFLSPEGQTLWEFPLSVRLSLVNFIIVIIFQFR